MDIYTVSFFGHREINDVFNIEKRLERIITDLVTQKEYIEFLIGRNGEFDQLVSSVIKRTTKRYNYGNTSLILVLPYINAEYRNNKNSYHEYYDDVEICPEASQAHFKAAMQIRNKCMVDRSDLVVCCIQKNFGGAYKTVKYAEKNNHKIINVATEN